jgi:tetratricopeptide (TPR) repeat protein
MSMTLNLADRLLSAGRNFQTLGRNQDALEALNRLAGFRDLPAAIAEETQARLAEIHLARGKYNRARRHLTAALVHKPQSARYHYLMAMALASDVTADRQRAAEHYRRSLEIDPQQPTCLGEFGLLALRLGQPEEGLASLRRAAEMAPSDVRALGRLVQGLGEEGRWEEARKLVRAAIFRNPKSADFRRLWEDFQYGELRRQQIARAGKGASVEDDGPTLLPFVRPPAGSAPVRLGRRIIRHDFAAQPARPHRRQGVPAPDQRHAQ